MINEYLDNALKRLKKSKLKVTQQRVELLKIMFANDENHFTPEHVHTRVKEIGQSISLATVYNTLKQFTQNGILKEIRVSPEKMYFDTNFKHHHHFYDKLSGKITDISKEKIKIKKIPELPKGKSLDSIEVLINIK